MKLVAKDSRYFYIVDMETDDVELLHNCDAFAIQNKLDLGIYRETDQLVSPRGHTKQLTVIKEVGYGSKLKG